MTNGVLAGKSNWNPIKHHVTTCCPGVGGLFSHANKTIANTHVLRCIFAYHFERKTGIEPSIERRQRICTDENNRFQQLPVIVPQIASVALIGFLSRHYFILNLLGSLRTDFLLWPQSPISPNGGYEHFGMLVNTWSHSKVVEIATLNSVRQSDARFLLDSAGFLTRRWNRPWLIHLYTTLFSALSTFE